MNLFVLLVRMSRGVVAAAVLCGLVSGAASAGLVAIINYALTSEGRSAGAVILGFVGLGLIGLVTRIGTQWLLSRLGQDALYRLRMMLSRRILNAPLRRVEEVGVHRLMAALADDVFAIAWGFMVAPGCFIDLAIIAGCLVYLAWLSWTVFFALLAFMTVGIATYWLMVVRAQAAYKLGREAQDLLFKHLRGLTEGVKELKQHRVRRMYFFDRVLSRTALQLQKFNNFGNDVYAAASSWGMFLFFGFIGLLLFVLPTLEAVSASTMTGYALTALYLQQPLYHIMGNMPPIGRGSVALRKVETLGLSLAEGAGADLGSEGAPAPRVAWTRLELRGITHVYHREQEDERFTLGPIDLTLQPGELVFLVGGNGSGKTTLAKVLTGLYVPETGDICVDGEPVTDTSRDDYRQMFSVVFSDFYLFDSLLGLVPAGMAPQLQAYLEKLHLQSKVRIEEGELSTTELSRGQRKRLALLAAYLEDRPVYVFDEWAADQDPTFKAIFYQELLPELKRAGKAVVVISHDDRYFHLADRLLHLEAGRLLAPDQVIPQGSSPAARVLG